jgi:hypothetical protein
MQQSDFAIRHQWAGWQALESTAAFSSRDHVFDMNVCRSAFDLRSCLPAAGPNAAVCRKEAMAVSWP